MADRMTALALGVIGAAAWHNLRAWRRAMRSAGFQEAQDPGNDWPATPRVSVLVAAWEESGAIARHIRSFKDLRYPAKQLVLCAGGSDGTYEIARGSADGEVIVLHQQPGEGKQRALQRCLEAADGEIIVLTDADCLYSDLAFTRLIQPMLDGQSDVVTGFRVPLREQRSNAIARLQWMTELADGGVRHHVNGLWGGNCGIRREAILRAGAFLEPAATGTDYVQARTLINAGYRIHWIPDSRVETRYPGDIASYLRVWRRWIKNVLIHGPRLGDWRGTGETVLSVVLAAGMLLSPLLAPIVGRAAILAPMTALSVATLNRMRRLAIGSHVTGSRPSLELLAIAPAFAVIDQLATVLAACDTLTRKGRRRW